MYILSTQLRLLCGMLRNSVQYVAIQVDPAPTKQLLFDGCKAYHLNPLNAELNPICQ